VTVALERREELCRKASGRATRRFCMLRLSGSDRRDERADLGRVFDARGRLDAAGHVNTGQRFFFRTVLDNLISDEEINEIMRGNIRKLYVYGTVFYRDSFNEEHYTNFCQFGVWDVAGNFSTINTTRHNDAT